VSLALLLLVTSVLSAREEPSGDEPALPALREAYGAARDAGDPARALEIAERAYVATLVPHLESLYAVTATHAALGDEDETYEWLERLLDAGFWDFRRLRDDPDFAAFRDRERFVRMWRGAWAAQYIAMLERTERDEFQQPERVLEALAIRPGERIADVGAGSGYFTVRLARAVGAGGSVLATDIREEMIAHLDARLEREGLENVRTLLATADDPMLPAGAFDTILLVDVWHYIRDPAFARRLRDGLAPGGRLVVVDYRPRPWEERPWGPPPEQQTPREEVDAHMAEAGLLPVRVHEFLREQYFVEYEARPADGTDPRQDDE